MRWVSFLFFVGAQIGVQALSSGPAAAVPGFSISAAKSATNSEPRKFVTARCPAGKRVLGGGGSIEARPSVFSKVVLEQIYPVHFSSEDSYTAIAQERSVGNSGDWSVTATAICGDPLPGLRIVSAGTSTPIGAASKVITANCPSGTVVIGTGAAVSFSDKGVTIAAVVPYGSEPNNPVAWERGVTVGAGFDPTDVVPAPANYSVTAWAICANRPPGYALSTFQLSPDTNNAVINNLIQCPAGKRVLGATGQIIDNRSTSHLVSLVPGTLRARFRASRRVNSAEHWATYVGAICAN